MQYPVANRTYRTDIDGLRAIAVLAVIAFHYYPWQLTGGFAGVDVFFVISGFLISSNIFDALDNQSFRFSDFYARRIRRLFPALIFVLTSVLGFALFALLADELKTLSKHIIAGVSFVANFSLLFESGYFDGAPETKPLLHLWSLGVEEQFYLLWPIFACLIWRFKSHRMHMIALLIVCSFYCNWFLVNQDKAQAFYLPQSRFWELLSGSLLACYLLSKPKFSKYLPVALASIVSLLGLVGLAYSFFHIDKAFAFPGFWSILPVISTLLILYAGTTALPNRLLLSNPIAVWLGRISYPLYLWHWPLVSFLWIVDGGKPSSNLRLISIVLAIFLAWFTYRFVEKPLRFNQSSSVLLSLIAAMFTLLIIGSTTYYQNGFPNRIALQGIDEVNSAPDMIQADVAYYHQQCLKLYDLSDKVRFCTNSLGANQKAKIALIGDSHAKVMYKAVTELSTTKQLGVANIGGRLFLDIAVYPNANIREVETYQGGIEATLAVAREQEIQHVIMFTRGPAYFDKELTFRSISHPELKDRTKILATGLRKTLDTFVNKRNIVFVIDNPDLNFEPRACVAGRPLRLTPFRENCSIPKEYYDQSAKLYRDTVLSVLKDYPNVKVFDMADYFCDDARCWAKKAGKILYLDNNHLSMDGARVVAKDLLKLLFK